MKRILAAIDASETSTLVLDRTLELARATGAKVHLFRALERSSSLPPPAETADRIEELLAAERTALRTILESLPEELRDGVTVVFGDPADAVCETARALDTDVVVIGARRYTRLARVLGTTAARIVNCIDRPVFVVRYPIDSEIASSVAGSALRSAGALLRTDHERLERIYAGLLAAYESGDWTEVRAQWDIFEPTLVAHIDAEEKHIFPGFRAIDPAEAEALMSEHGELRKALGAFGVRVDLHALGAADVEQLVMRLRAHASREERLLYPWTDANVEVSAIEQALATASMRPAQALRTSA